MSPQTHCLTALFPLLFRRMEIDWTTLHEQYHGQWLAMAADEKTVLGTGMTAKKALEDAKKNGHEHPILLRMPETITAFVGAAV